MADQRAGEPRFALVACFPGCGWNDEVEIADDNEWTCPRCGQHNTFHDHVTHAERLSKALREVIGSHYCGQLVCSRAVATLNDYERDVEGRRAGEVTRG